MSINFKFRSAATFDSVDLGGRSSITIRDLRAEILKKKHLDVCKDFDLLFSDLSGREFDDEDTRVPSGSSVIIKRVPAGSLPSLRACNVSAGNLQTMKADNMNLLQPSLVKVQVDEFDDFGADVCPLPDQKFPSPVHEVDEPKYAIGGTKFPASLSEVLKDPSVNEGSTLEVKSDVKVDGSSKLVRPSPASYTVTQSADLPHELKCLLCCALLKDAVMIPCCQHSFCEKCICHALSKDRKCPICSSSKCREGDLLPNLSLRQAINRFLESKFLVNNSEADLHRYEPDGESGIEVKDASCAITIGQQKSQFGRSIPSLNHVSLSGNRQLQSHPENLKDKSNNFEDVSEYQGENQPTNALEAHEEGVNRTKRNEGFWDRTGDGERNVNALPRQRRAERTCYMCGSPDHLIRECPVAASSRTDYRNDVPFVGAAPSYGPAYWQQTPFTHGRPFVNMCGSQMMMPGNAAMGPQFHQQPFTVPSYNPNMYGGFPVSRDFVSMGGMAKPLGVDSQHIPYQPELLEHQDWETRQKSSNNNLRRERASSGRDVDSNKQFQYNDGENLKSHHDRGVQHYEDSNIHSSEKTHRREKHLDNDNRYRGERLDKSSGSFHGGRDRKNRSQGRSMSEIDNLRDSSIGHTKEKHKHNKHSSSRKSDDVKGHRDEYRAQSHHHPLNEKGSPRKRSSSPDEKIHCREHYNRSESGIDPSSAGERSRRRRGRESSEESHRSKQAARYRETERSKRARDSENDYRDYYHDHKRKRGC